jgi:hypothetical protein
MCKAENPSALDGCELRFHNNSYANRIWTSSDGDEVPKEFGAALRSSMRPGLEAASGLTKRGSRSPAFEI